MPAYTNDYSLYPSNFRDYSHPGQYNCDSCLCMYAYDPVNVCNDYFHLFRI